MEEDGGVERWGQMASKQGIRDEVTLFPRFASASEEMGVSSDIIDRRNFVLDHISGLPKPAATVSQKF